MLIHKDIIIRLFFTFIFIVITFRVLGPVFLNYLKTKIPGSYPQENDIDSMIRRQKERLRSQYGLVQTPERTVSQPVSVWGNDAFSKKIQQEIAKTYSYTMPVTKVKAFILLCEKRNFLQFLSLNFKNDTESIKNYTITLLVFFLLLEEVREKKFFILEKIAKKIGVSSNHFALAFQIKVFIELDHNIKLAEDKIFTDHLNMNFYSEDILKLASEKIFNREANLWAKGPSLFFEEMTLVLNYASILLPLPKLKDKNDINTAAEILGLTLESSLDDTKKAYKKLSLSMHPDKVIAQKLPKFLESKAIQKYNSIQEAYNIVLSSKK